MRDRDYQSGAGTVDVDTYQALILCILARVVCNSPQGHGTAETGNTGSHSQEGSTAIPGPRGRDKWQIVHAYLPLTEVRHPHE